MYRIDTISIFIIQKRWYIVREDIQLLYATWDDIVKAFRIQALYYNEIISYLEKNKFNFKDNVQDLIPCSNFSCILYLKHYQKEAMNKRQNVGKRETIILPTVFGKTVISIKAIEIFNQSTIIVVPTS